MYSLNIIITEFNDVQQNIFTKYLFVILILDKEDNNKIKDVIFEFLTSTSANEGGSGGGGLELNRIDAEDPEISDYNMIPDTCKLADQLRVCLQESDQVPADYTRLFNTRLYSISTSLVPAAIKV